MNLVLLLLLGSTFGSVFFSYFQGQNEIRVSVNCSLCTKKLTNIKLVIKVRKLSVFIILETYNFAFISVNLSIMSVVTIRNRMFGLAKINLLKQSTDESHEISQLLNENGELSLINIAKIVAAKMRDFIVQLQCLL